jgi:hypothetical protein
MGTGKSKGESVYILQAPVDDSGWGSLIPTDDSSVLGLPPEPEFPGLLRDFFHFVPAERNWKPNVLTKVWRPLAVLPDRNRVKSYNDYPTLSVGILKAPAFSQRAVDALRDLLERDGEILPLAAPPEIGAYYAFNTLTVADALDLPRCRDVEYYGEGPNAFQIASIERFEFLARELSGVSIFQLPEFPSRRTASRNSPPDLCGYPQHLTIARVSCASSSCETFLLTHQDSRHVLRFDALRRISGPVATGPIAFEIRREG